jgi:hypothetical protein
MDWIKRLFTKKVVEQCATHGVSKRYMVNYKTTFNGVIWSERNTVVDAHSEELAKLHVECISMATAIVTSVYAC